MTLKPHLHRRDSIACYCYLYWYCQYSHCVYLDIREMYATKFCVNVSSGCFEVLASSRSSKWFGYIKRCGELRIYYLSASIGYNIWHSTEWLWYAIMTRTYSFYIHSTALTLSWKFDDIMPWTMTIFPINRAHIGKTNINFRYFFIWNGMHRKDLWRAQNVASLRSNYWSIIYTSTCSVYIPPQFARKGYSWMGTALSHHQPHA